jgi:hypothetical protein
MTLFRGLVDRFIAWNNRALDMPPKEVAVLLRKFVDDTATHSEWDYFCTGRPLADPDLEAIRNEVGELYGPRVEPCTTERLQELLGRAEAIVRR